MSNNEIENQMSALSIQQKKDQPLRRSTYNINEAFNNTIPNAANLLFDASSIHPLDKTNHFNRDQSAYALDLHPSYVQPNTQQQQQQTNRQDLNGMMKDLTLSSTRSGTNNTTHKSSMPYCV
jgi:hypothetical protein